MPSQFLDLQTPTRLINRAPSDTVPLPATTMRISLVVTTAGILKVQMWGDAPTATTAEIDLGVGTHFIDGNFKLVYSTGTTAVFTGTRVAAWIFDPSTVNY